MLRATKDAKYAIYSSNGAEPDVHAARGHCEQSRIIKRHGMMNN